LLTAKEVASPEYLNIPVSTLHYWSHIGEGPPVILIGSRLRYRESELMRWIEAQRKNRAPAR